MNHSKIYSPILFLLLLALSQVIIGQPNTLWMTTLGGSADDEGFSVQETQDGGFIITGYTKSDGAGDKDVWLIKTDADGKESWEKTFGGTGEDIGNAVLQTEDGGYIVAGYTKSFGAGQKDFWLIKTDSKGKETWAKTIGGASNDAGYSIAMTDDGGYILTGETFSFGAGSFDVWLVKTDASGDTLWTQTFGGASYERGESVQQTKDGGYIITGYTASSGAGFTDLWIIKTDASGNEEWSKIYGGSNYDKGLSVQQTTDDGYIVLGFNKSWGPGIEDYWLLKTDTSGDTLWTKIYGDVEGDEGQSVVQTADGGYALTGLVTANGIHNLGITKTDSAGDTTWTKTYVGDGVGEGNDWGTCIQQTSDLGYIVTGVTESDGSGGRDIWLIRLAPESNVAVKDDFIASNEFQLHQNYPNPFNSQTTISYQLPVKAYVSLDVFDIHGRTVATLVEGEQAQGHYRVPFSVNHLPSGVYIYRLETNEQIMHQRMILLK